MTKMDNIQKQPAQQPPEGLALLRVPFAAHQISKLPKPTKAQTDAVKADYKTGVRCKICGTWHHKDVVHLDYVGHAALTDRLLDCDPLWNWEPVAVTPLGTPAMDENGGMWIRLTVCGVTRLGYGHADGKRGGDALKEVIGDALRNAAMRFGAALDLWHKGDLHADEPQEVIQETRLITDEIANFTAAITSACLSLEMAEDVPSLNAVWKGLRADVKADAKVIKAGKDRKAALTDFSDIAYEGAAK